jgi:hypothetical protein
VVGREISSGNITFWTKRRYEENQEIDQEELRSNVTQDLASYRVASIAFNACSVPCDFSSGRSQFVDKTLKGHAGIICKFWCQKQSSAIVLLFYTMSIEKEARYNAVPEDTEMSILVEQL